MIKYLYIIIFITSSFFCDDWSISANLHIVEVDSLFDSDGVFLDTEQNIIFDTNNFLGMKNDALDGYDGAYDIPEPPHAPDRWVSLYFPHPEWDHSLGDNFTQDIRSDILLNPQDRIIQWDFNIESNASGTAILNFNIFENYCYSCIESIELDVNGSTYLIPLYELGEFNISVVIESYNIVPCSLVVTFLDFNTI